MTGTRIYEGETFRGLSLSGEAVENLSFRECEFVDSVFSGVTVRNSSFRSCRFTRCRIELPHGFSTSMQNLEIDGCFLSGVQWFEFSSGNRYVPLFASLTDTTMRYAVFSEMKLRGFSFAGLRITDSTFADCDLAETSFRDMDLTGTEFYRCDLTEADFRDAVGYRIDVLNSKVRGARFSLPDAVGLLSGLGVRID